MEKLKNIALFINTAVTCSCIADSCELLSDALEVLQCLLLFVVFEWVSTGLNVFLLKAVIRAKLY